MKKLIILISTIIIFFIIFLIMYLSPRDYQKEYIVDNIKIIEEYEKEYQGYTFKFYYEDNLYETFIKNKYSTKRALIKKINIKEEKDSICLVPESKYLKFNPICYREDKQISYHLLAEEENNNIKTIDETYNNIKINYLNDKTFLLWNYKGFYLINKDIKKEIEVLNKDSYNIALATKINNYLVLPDYNMEHKFNKLYIIDIKKGTVDTWNLNIDIYFDSYVIGTNKKSIFIYDSKEEIEYELRPDKKKIRKIKYRAIKDSNWVNITKGDLNSKTTFTYLTKYNYFINDGNLYLRYLNGDNDIIVSNADVKDIVYVENDTVYYLKENSLYMFNELDGEILLLQNFEWSFNYNNMIFIY